METIPAKSGRDLGTKSERTSRTDLFIVIKQAVNFPNTTKPKRKTNRSALFRGQSAKRILTLFSDCPRSWSSRAAVPQWDAARLQAHSQIAVLSLSCSLLSFPICCLDGMDKHIHKSHSFPFHVHFPFLCFPFLVLSNMLFRRHGKGIFTNCIPYPSYFPFLCFPFLFCHVLSLKRLSFPFLSFCFRYFIVLSCLVYSLVLSVYLFLSFLYPTS